MMDIRHFPPSLPPSALHQLCHVHCDAVGSAYMALEYGTECWCSHDGALDYERHGVGNCDMPCAGDDAEICGGYHTVKNRSSLSFVEACVLDPAFDT